MLPNDQSDPESRLSHLIDAIKLVYASTYFIGPKAFSKRIGQLVEEEKMAVIIQRLIGVRQGRYFYPAISGVAQSQNYYPFSAMRSEEGVASIALGLGKSVMDGERALRFSPAHPEIFPNSSSVNELLKNAQRYFYALELEKEPEQLDIEDCANLVKREIADAEGEPVVRELLSTYYPEENRIRDSFGPSGWKVLTFSKILKFGSFPLAVILRKILAMGQEAMGCPVEIEFCVDAVWTQDMPSSFSILQMRPMSSRENMKEIIIPDNEIKRAVCVSTQAIGNTVDSGMKDIVYVDRDGFDPSKTREMASEISNINSSLQKEGKKYLLIGPGRWGSADRWLGIPVRWTDISGVGAIIETAHAKLRVEPSQGAHFFHNITSLGISYLTIFQENKDVLDWEWLVSRTRQTEHRYVAHIRLEEPFTLKVDGRRSLGIVLSACHLC
jgi:hypothetical protein